MIRSFRHRGLRLYHETGNPRLLPQAHVRRITRILLLLDRASGPQQMAISGFRLHPLKGDLERFWSVTVSANRRIIFRFEDSDVVDVDLVDYHQEGGRLMSALEPLHPGETIRYDCIEGCGLTIAEAAAHMGVAERDLREVCHCRAPITPDLAVRIEMAFGGDSEVWLALQAAHDLANARKRAAELNVRIERIPEPDLDLAAAD